MPDFTIVTPSFNQARFVRRTIESVLSQGVDLEYIILDNCSTDGTAAILEEYRGRARIIVAPDRGQADAIATGFAAATGRILAWINADDMYLPGALARVRKEFDAGREFVYGHVAIVDEADRVLRRRVTVPVTFGNLYFDRYILPQEATFFSRRLYEACGGVRRNLRMAMDYDLWIRMARLARPRRVNAFLAAFRFRAGQKSADPAAYHREVEEARARLTGVVPRGALCGATARLRLSAWKLAGNVRESGWIKTFRDVADKRSGKLP